MDLGGRSTIQRYYLEPKKRETSGSFLWSKVLLDKGITIGRNSGFRTKMGELIILNWMVMESEIRRMNDSG